MWVTLVTRIFRKIFLSVQRLSHFFFEKSDDGDSNKNNYQFHISGFLFILHFMKFILSIA